MQNEDVQNLAEKIAKLIGTESTTPDFLSLQVSIEAINKRLDRLESKSPIPHSALPIPHSPHPSKDRFAIAEAIVDSLFDNSTKEKACTFEPNGKPCDHCSMCNSRGF